MVNNKSNDQVRSSEEQPTTQSETPIQTTETQPSSRLNRVGGPAGLAAMFGIGGVFLIGGTAAGLYIGRGFDRPGGDRSSGTSRSPQGANGPMGQGGGMQGSPRDGMRGGSTGKVTAVSAISITLKDERSGGSITFGINGDTDVTNDGKAAAIPDVKVGETVRVTGTTDNDDTTAATVELNPAVPSRRRM